MNLDPWLKLGHILGAIVWLGGGFALSIVGSRARASNDPRVVQEFARTLSYVGPRVMTPAVIGTIVFGVALVLTSAAWDFGQLWVLIGLGLFVVAFAIGVGYLSRIGIRLGHLADAPLPSLDEANHLLSRWIVAYRVVLVLLVVVVWDMVFKPGL
jgi:uncharacterized membrane protein